LLRNKTEPKIALGFKNSLKCFTGRGRNSKSAKNLNGQKYQMTFSTEMWPNLTQRFFGDQSQSTVTTVTAHSKIIKTVGRTVY
jgi:hypothetical protein